MQKFDEKAPVNLDEAIDAIESAYELMLAYAAQGRAREEGDPMGVRRALENALVALDLIGAASPDTIVSRGGASAASVAGFLAIIRQDAEKARAIFAFVLGQALIGSQLIDNLNASIHVRALLTDLFLLDEAISAG